jgi:hypothetical protein
LIKLRQHVLLDVQVRNDLEFQAVRRLPGSVIGTPSRHSGQLAAV